MEEIKEVCVYHLDVALGSAFELETQIGVAGEFELTNEIKEIEKMIIGLRKSIRTQS